MALKIPENRVVDIWQSPVQRRADIKIAADYPVRIIYPGRPNDGRGADIKDVVILTPQGLIKGDIEFHVKSSGWRQHGHHEDPAYNSVVLHVVHRDNTGQTTRLQDGTEIPVLALDRYTEEQAQRRLTSVFTSISPSACRTRPEAVPALLDEAGEARLLLKSAEFAESLLKESAGQVLYKGIMTALGYSKNKEPMAKLADTVRQEEIEEIAARYESEDECFLEIESRLMGAAGLLPSQRFPGMPCDEPVTKLEKRWVENGGQARMSVNEWEFFKVRPGNYPVRRIAAMAALLTKYRNQGIFQALKSVLETAGENDFVSLEKALRLNAAGYWENHVDFGKPVKSTVTALLGSERAAAIIINVLIPFFTAYAQAESQPELEQKASEIYYRYPAAAENSLEKHMRLQLGVSPKTVRTAQRRQGLMHIYKTLCTQGKCDICPLH